MFFRADVPAAQCADIFFAGTSHRGPAVAEAIETFLLRFPRGSAVVGRTPLVGTLPGMLLPATERTTQVRAMCVAGMRQKANAAVCAANNATPQFGMGLEDRIQSGLILTDKRLGAIVLVPVIAKRENFPDGDDKKARFSLIMLSVLHTPSSYLLDAKASRGRARFFYARKRTPSLPFPTIATTAPACAGHAACQLAPAPPARNHESGYLEERTPLLRSR